MIFPVYFRTINWLALSQVQARFPRIAAEAPESFERARRYPDPYVVGNKHRMGRTHTPRPGNSSAPNLDNASDTDDDLVVLEVFHPLSLTYTFSLRGHLQLTGILRFWSA
jgi:hypothetical protein